MNGSFEDTCDALGVPYRSFGDHHHSREGWVQIDCPFCGSGTHKFHMGYPIGGFVLSCWRCGRHGLVESLQEASGVSHSVIRRLVNSWRIRRPTDGIKRGKYERLIGVGPLHSIHLKYIKQRGFDPEQLERLWGIECTEYQSRLPWRLFIPITFQGREVSWTTRSIVDSGMRYISAERKHEEIHHKDLLYGEDYCTNAVVVCEGPTDVWRIGPGSVATFGTSFTQAQLLRLTRFPIRAICFDNEGPAQKQADSICNELALFPGNTYKVKLKANDPGSALEKEVQEIRRNFLT